MNRPKREQPTFPVGYRFSLDKDALEGQQNETGSKDDTTAQVREETTLVLILILVQKSKSNLIGFELPADLDVTKISGSKAMHDDDDEDEHIILSSQSTQRVIHEASEVLAQRMSVQHRSASQTSLHRRKNVSTMSNRQSRVMAGISVDRILYSNRIIRMIADHEKEQDEINELINDWIFFGLVIDRILLVFFGIVFLMGSFGLFYRFMFNLRAEQIYEDEY